MNLFRHLPEELSRALLRAEAAALAAGRGEVTLADLEAARGDALPEAPPRTARLAHAADLRAHLEAAAAAIAPPAPAGSPAPDGPPPPGSDLAATTRGIAQRHRVALAPDALDAARELARERWPDHPEAEVAADLLDEAAARTRLDAGSDAGEARLDAAELRRRVATWLGILLLATTALAPPAHAAPGDPPVASLRERLERLRRSRQVPMATPESSAQVSLAETRLASGDPAGALDAARQGLASLENEPPEARAQATLVLGRVYMGLGEWGLAERAFLRAQDLVPAESPLGLEALDALARLVARELPSPETFRAQVDEYLHQDPLTLDEDAARYLLGFTGGLRIARIDRSLAALQAVWEAAGARPPADRARLHAAILRGFVLDQRDEALALLDDLREEHPSSALVGLAGLAQGFLELGSSDREAALKAVSDLPPEDDRAREAALFGATVAGYMMGDGPRALGFLESLERRPGPLHQLGRYHRALLLTTRQEDFATARRILDDVEPGEEVPASWKDLLQSALDRILDAKSPAERQLRFARFFERVGHYPRARFEYEELLERFPGGPTSAKAKLRLAALEQDDRGRLAGEIPALEEALASQQLPPAFEAEARWRLARARLYEGVPASKVFREVGAAGAAFDDAALRGLVLNTPGHDPDRLEILEGVARDLDPADPARPRVLARLGEALRAAGNWDEALDVYQTLLPDVPGAAEEVQRLMDRRRVRGLSPGGAEPRAPGARTRLALFHLRLGEVERAESLLDGARQEDDGDPVASARAAAFLARLLHARKGRPERIREVLEDALEREELPLRDRLVLRELQARRLPPEESDAAEEILRSLVRQGYGVRRLLPELVKYRRDRDGEEAGLGLFSLLVGELQPDARMTALAAELYDATGQPRRARDARQRLVEAWPESPEADAARGLLTEEAARGLRRLLATSLPPERKLEALEEFLAGASPSERAQHRLVVDAWARQLEADTPPAVRVGLGRLYLDELQDPGRALPLLGAARELDGLVAEEALLDLARTQRIQGDLRGAFGTFEELASRGGREVPAARLAQARLQLETFGDPQAAWDLAQRGLASSPGPGMAVQLLRVLGAAGKAAEKPASQLEKALSTVLAATRGSDQEGPVLLQLAELRSQGGAPTEAGRRFLDAAARLVDPDEATQAALRGLDLLMESGQYAAVNQQATRFLTSRPGVPGTEEIRSRLRKASSRIQLRTFENSLDWTDPESSRNRELLWRAAQLLVNPLEDFPAAATRLQELTQLFPGSSEARQAEALLAKLPVLEAASSVGPHRPQAGKTKGVSPGPTRPEDRLAAARFVEYRLQDQDRAAAQYREIFEEDPGVIGAFAGLALLRLVALDPTQQDEAWDLVRRLRTRPLPVALQGRLRARVATLAAAPRWQTLETRARAGGHGGDEALGEMVRRAASLFQDGSLAMGALRRIQDRGAKFEAALAAAAALDPSASPAPEAPVASDFHDFAVQVAPDASRRAQALLARGKAREASPAPSRALPDYQQAARLAPGTPAGEEALYRRSRLLLQLGRDEEAALAGLEQLVDLHPGGARYVIASENAAELTRRLEARRLDTKAAREGPDDPGLYFRTARLLSDRFEALPEALENYRTYIRVGQRDRTLIEAHLEAAQVLVRMDKSREAVLMLDRLIRQSYAGLDRSAVALKRAKLFELELADLEAAIQAYKTVVAKYPQSKAAREAEEGLARIRGLQGEGDAPPAELDGDMPASLEAIRAEYLRGRRKRYAAAAEALRAALERSRERPERAALALELARIEKNQLERKKSAAEAYEIFLAAGTPGRTQADAMLELAELYAEDLKKPARALKLYDDFLERYNSHRRRVPTMVERGKVLESLDRVQEALEVYRVIADSFPRSGNDEIALERLAYLKRTYFAAFSEAVAAYRELIARFPFSRLADDAQYAVGRIFEIELGDLNQARIEYETLIQRYPTSEYLIRAQNGLTRIARR